MAQAAWNRDDESGSWRIVAGLGNPGTGYAGTRHNVGFETVDRLAEQFGVEIRRKKFGGLVGEGIFDNRKVVLLKPQEFMNCSGRAVSAALQFYKLGPSELLVITDDLALEPGVIRLRAKGSSGGHNGLSDIIAALGRDDFARLRIGIGGCPSATAKDYVLSRPSGPERQRIEAAMEQAVQAVLCWIHSGIETAMNRYNERKKLDNNEKSQEQE
ncbi:MAG: aminoacyl-tRNA hydrolase [Phycisphaerae bacterium]|nr:aminoacyl-tRNA hydrolase [Phycisphaerae bacterium]